MDSVEGSWFAMATTRMDWSAARQKIIAENVANADTPDYVGRDVVSFEQHLAASLGEPRRQVSVEDAKNSWGGSFDGNKVVLEEQVMLSSQMASDYALAAQMYRKGHQLIGIAVSSR